jgi:NAD(P)-dependent dehydrogenase (short-subunit alcohol dehydrogenase family)
MTHPAMAPGRVAVVTGAANGIGLASIKRYALFGMKVCLADVDGDALAVASKDVAEITEGGIDDVMTVTTDVGRREDILALKDAVYDRFGEVAVLMNNAATRARAGALENVEAWEEALSVNLWGVINGTQAFVPAMIAQNSPCVVVNSSSKQGITLPPGNTSYNVSKAGVKAYTELLQHELRNTEGCQVTAHLLVPGWTTRGGFEFQPGQWSPGQVVDVMLPAIERGDFYIICPDDDVTPEMDSKRILWSAGDVAYNRPPLSRWHGDYDEAFKNFDPPSK